MLHSAPPPPPHLLWDKSGQQKPLCGGVLIFKEGNKIALKKKKKKRCLGGDHPTHTSTQSMHKHTNRSVLIFASNGPSEQSAVEGCADMQSPATLRCGVPMVPQHVASLYLIVLCIQGVSERTFSICDEQQTQKQQHCCSTIFFLKSIYNVHN